jgi:hypothetical protein
MVFDKRNTEITKIGNDPLSRSAQSSDTERAGGRQVGGQSEANGREKIEGLGARPTRYPLLLGAAKPSSRGSKIQCAPCVPWALPKTGRLGETVPTDRNPNLRSLRYLLFTPYPERDESAASPKDRPDRRRCNFRTSYPPNFRTSYPGGERN